jgi:PilZ domain
MVYDPPRLYERLPMPLEVRILGAHAARSRDLSMGGCYIETVAHVTVGQFLLFELKLPSGRWLSLRGEVIYHRRNHGFGVGFVDLPEETQRMLEHLIDYARGM